MKVNIGIIEKFVNERIDGGLAGNPQAQAGQLAQAVKYRFLTNLITVFNSMGHEIAGREHYQSVDELGVILTICEAVYNVPHIPLHELVAQSQQAQNEAELVARAETAAQVAFNARVQEIYDAILPELETSRYHPEALLTIIAKALTEWLEENEAENEAAVLKLEDWR